jgi:YD repeat-containing protein
MATRADSVFPGRLFRGAVPSLLSFAPPIAMILFMAAAANSWGQITNVTNDQATPTLGAGHDYIGSLDEIVSPGNGSLSLRVTVPTPQGRGLSLPIQFSYNSSGIIQMTSLLGTSSPGQFFGSVGVISNADSRFLEQGGWGYGLPLLSAAQIQVPGNNPSGSGSGGTCPVVTGFLFSDPAGSRHSMNLAMPNYSTCNTTGVAPGYSMTGLFADNDGSYYSWTTNPQGQGTDDVQGVPFSVSDNSGTYYHFPFLAALPGCFDYCNVPDYVEDRNGNKITFQWGSSTNPFPLTVMDTAGRNLITIPGFASATGDQLTITGYSEPYVVTWESIPYSFSAPVSPVSANSSNCNSSIPAPSTSGSMRVVKSITLPNGESYQFGYDPTYGLLNKITYPTGAYIQYAWGPSTQPSDAVYYSQSGALSGNASQFDDCAAVYSALAILHRYVYFDGQNLAQQQDFTYSTPFPGGGGAWNQKTTTVVTTDYLRTGHPSLTTAYTYWPLTISPPPDIIPGVASQVPVEHQISYQDVNGSLLQTVTKKWTGYNTNPVLQEQDVTLPNGQTAVTAYRYDVNNNILEEDEYDYGQSVATRTTTNQYQTFNSPRAVYYSFPPAILDEKCKSVVYSESSSGTRISETDFEYDGGTTVCGSAGTPSVTAVSGLPAATHDEASFGASSTISRGNLTTSLRWANAGASPTTTYTYDETGQTLTQTDPCGNPTTACSDMPSSSTHKTTYSYTDSYASGTPNGSTNTYVTKITKPAVNGVAEITSYSYNYANGLLASSTDVNTQPTNYTYGDPLNRLTEVQGPPDPDNGSQRPTTTHSFNDSIAQTPPYEPTITTTTALTSSISVTNKATMDPYGHTIETELTSDPSGPVYVISTYDGLGRVASATNAYRTTSDQTYGATYYLYDALNRPTFQTQPDSSTRKWCYNGIAPSNPPAGVKAVCNSHLGSVATGSWVDSSDEVGNTWQRSSDAWGRLTEVMEPNGIVQTPGMETDYAYDGLNDLTGVKQWGGANGSSGSRSRGFSYDSLSRLIQAFNPEAGWTCYGTTGGAAPNGANCTSGYDANGNLMNKTDARGVTTNYKYDALNRVSSKSYANDVSQTPSVCYQYDASTVSNSVGRLTNEWTQRANAGVCPAAPPSSGILTRRSVLLYDPMGRIRNEQQCTPSTCTAGTPYAPSYTYDLAGNLLTATNGITTTPTVNTLTLTNGYDAAGHLQTVMSNWNADPTHPSFLFSAQTAASTPCAKSLPAAYTPFGTLANATFGNGLTLNRGFDTRARITCEIDTGGVVTAPISASATVTITGEEQSK